MAKNRKRESSVASKQTALEITRFGLAGFVNMLVGFVIYAISVSVFSAPFWLANFAAIIGSLFSGYYLAQKFVFVSNGKGLRESAVRYVFVIGLQFALTTLIIGVLVSRGQGEVIAYIMALPAAIALSFSLQKLWVFKASHRELKI